MMLSIYITNDILTSFIKNNLKESRHVIPFSVIITQILCPLPRAVTPINLGFVKEPVETKTLGVWIYSIKSCGLFLFLEINIAKGRFYGRKKVTVIVQSQQKIYVHHPKTKTKVILVALRIKNTFNSKIITALQYCVGFPFHHQPHPPTVSED